MTAAMLSMALSCPMPASTSGGYLSEALGEMTFMDFVNLVRYHRRLFTLIDAVRFASTESNRLFPGDPQAPNGKGNAFKHALWSAVLSAEIDEKAAKRLTDGHEDWVGNPANEKAMDLHNNKSGIAIGRRLRGRKRAAIEDAVTAELLAGGLRYLKDGKLVPTNE
jgi:hypothetical protein